MAPSQQEELTRKRRDAALRRRYNITLEQYEAILAYQGGKCAICLRPPKDGGKSLSTDHDHKTGQVRGLLCWGCNAALGKFRDNRENIIRASEYVLMPPAVGALGHEVYGPTGRVDSKRKKRIKRKPNQGENT